MTRLLVRLTLGCTVALGSTSACSNVLAAPTGYGSARHFVTITGGIARYLGDERPPADEMTIPELVPTGEPELSHPVEFAARYRYAIRPGTEVFAEYSRIGSSANASYAYPTSRIDLHSEFRTESWGVGLRASDIDGRIRPFLQASFALARSGDEASWNADSRTFGMGAATGVDIGVAEWLSIPIELAARFAMPLDEITTLGLRSGLTFNAVRREARVVALPFVPPPAAVPIVPAPPPRLHVAVQYGVGGHIGTIQPESYAYPTARTPMVHPQSTLPGSSVGDFFDLATGTAMGIAFRGSIHPGTDLVFETIRAVSVRTETFGGISARRSRYSTLCVGLGVRATRPQGRVRPFAQAGLAAMDTGVHFLSGESGSRGASGLATNFVAGAEVMASRTLSIPVECRVLIGWTGGDQAHVGVHAGLAYGFGH